MANKIKVPMANKIIKSVAQVSKETLLIQGFLEKQEDGAELSYEKIQHETRVDMDTKGKSYLRTAVKRAKKEYSCMIGYGIKLADTKTTMPIMVDRLKGIERKVRRAEKTHKNLQTQFFESLPSSEQKEILYIGAVFGAIKVAAQNGQVIYSRKNKIMDTISIPLPLQK